MKISPFILMLLMCFSAIKVTALNYYWIGGSGNWSTLSHWATTSGGTTLHTQIPTALDDVFFDINSFSSAGQVVNFDAPTTLAHSISWTGATGTPQMVGSNLIKIYGSLNFIQDLDINNLTGDIFFESVNPGQTITMAGQHFNGSVSFNGIGGGWVLQDPFDIDQSMVLNAGSLDFNNQAVNVGAFYSTSTSVRSLNMGSSIFNISGVNSNSCWNVKSAGLTLNCGTSVINFNRFDESEMSGDNTGGALVFYDVNFNANPVNGLNQVIGAHTFHNVNFHAQGNVWNSCTFNNLNFDKDGQIQSSNTISNLSFTPGYTYTLWNGTVQTINNTFNVLGNCGELVTINTNNTGSPATISHATGPVNIYYAVMRDIHSSGGANFIASNSTDLGNNTGWTFNSSGVQNLYWVGNSGNWSDGSHWSLTSGGSPSGCLPTPLSNVIFDANSFSLAGSQVLLDPATAYCRNMDWANATNTPTFLSDPYPTNILKMYGSLVFSPGMITNVLTGIDFESVTPGQTITMAGQHFFGSVSFNGIGGGWVLQDPFDIDQAMTLNAGSLDFNDQPVNVSAFYSTTTSVRSLNMGSSIFNISGVNSNSCWNVKSAGLTLNCGTSVINFNRFDESEMSGDNTGGALVFYDVNFNANPVNGLNQVIGAHTFHNVNFHAQGNIWNSCTFNNLIFDRDGQIQSSNTFNNLSFTPGYTYTLWNGTVQTINNTFNVLGNCGELITINTNNTGLPATISHVTGSVNIYYAVMRDIHTTGGANFIASNSTDLGNNTGWTFNSSAVQNLYWVGNSGNWSDGSHWSLTSGGTASGCLPTPLSNVFFDANSFSAPGAEVLIDQATAYCRDMNWAAATNTPTFSSDPYDSHILKMYGSLVFSLNMITNISTEIDFESVTPGQTITMAGQHLNGGASFNGIGGGWVLQDPFDIDQPMTLNAGSLDFNDQAVNVSAFYSTSTSVRSLNMGSSIFNISGASSNTCWNVKSAGLILNCGTSVINFNRFDESEMSGDNTGGALVFYDVNFNANPVNGLNQVIGAHTFHNVNFHAQGNIWNNCTFNNLSFDRDGQIQSSNTINNLNFTPGYTYTLWSGSTQTVNDHWQIQGTCTSYIVLKTNNVGSAAAVSKNVGSVLGHNIHIKDISCTGTANFMAYNSVDLGGNTGWQFSTLPALNNPGSITGPTTLCSGDTATYSISPVQGAIYYQWATSAGATILNGQGDTSIVVDWGTAIPGTVSVHSYNGCSYSVDSSSLSIVTGAVVTPLVSLSASDTSICPGASATFTATVLNSGSANVNYEFMVNGIIVQNNNSNNFSTATLSNGDVISCSVTLSGGAACYASTTAMSNSISMIVGQNPNLVPSIHITGTDMGTSVLIASTITNGGVTPAYQWQDSTINHVWQDIIGANNSSLTYTPQVTGDKVRCKLSGNANCGIYDTAVSNALTFTLDSNDIIISGRLYPNPVHTTLNIDGLDPSDQWETVEIIDQTGRREYFENVSGRTTITINVSRLPNSNYYIILKSEIRKPGHFKFIKL